MDTGDIVSVVIIQDNAKGWQSRCDYVVDKESRVPGRRIVGERRKSCGVDLKMILMMIINAAASIRKSLFKDALRKRFLITITITICRRCKTVCRPIEQRIWHK